MQPWTCTDVDDGAIRSVFNKNIRTAVVRARRIAGAELRCGDGQVSMRTG